MSPAPSSIQGETFFKGADAAGLGQGPERDPRSVVMPWLRLVCEGVWSGGAEPSAVAVPRRVGVEPAVEDLVQIQPRRSR